MKFVVTEVLTLYCVFSFKYLLGKLVPKCHLTKRLEPPFFSIFKFSLKNVLLPSIQVFKPFVLAVRNAVVASSILPPKRPLQQVSTSFPPGLFLNFGIHFASPKMK